MYKNNEHNFICWSSWNSQGVMFSFHTTVNTMGNTIVQLDIGDTLYLERKLWASSWACVILYRFPLYDTSSLL